MKRITKITLALLLLASMLLGSTVPALAAGETVSNTDIDQIEATDWMSYLPDEAYVSALNMPGTHDAGLSLATLGAGRFAQCQTLTITKQLEAGVRFFDIRLRYAGDPDDVGTPKEKRELYVCHGEGAVCCDGYVFVTVNGKSEKVNYTYKAILNEMADFLDKHPSETIFYFVRNEYLSGDEKRSTTDLDAIELNACYVNTLEYDERKLNERLMKEGKTAGQMEVLSPANGYSQFYNQTLKDCRGKMFRFMNEFGFGDMMNADRFNDWNSAYNDKWDNLKPYFDSAPVQTLFVAKTKKFTSEEDEQKNPNKNTFRAAWTSCTGMYTYNEDGEKTWNNLGVETIDIFDWIDDGYGFPTGGEEAEKMNNLLMNYRFDWGAYYGWIAMDMVTPDLARLIFQTNDFNQQGKIVSKKVKTYIKDIEGFCDVSYDDAVQRCYEKGFTPLPARINKNKRTCYDINPEGYPIVLGYTTTTNPAEAITDIVGRFDSKVPNGYRMVTVNNSLFDYFNRGAGWFTTDTYLYVSRDKSKAPIRELEIMYNKRGSVDEGMVSQDFGNDKSIGSKTVFNLQEDVDNLFVGLKMIREDSANKFGTVFGTGNIVIIICCVVILVLAVLLMLEMKKKNELLKRLENAAPNNATPVNNTPDKED